MRKITAQASRWLVARAPPAKVRGQSKLGLRNPLACTPYEQGSGEYMIGTGEGERGERSHKGSWVKSTYFIKVVPSILIPDVEDQGF